MFESSILLRREPLPRPELDALLARYRREAVRWGAGSKRAIKIRNTIIEVNMRLVATVAKRYRVPAGWEFDELLAIGSTGLVTAIERFDLGRGLCFSTYASWWVRHAISRALADTGATIRVPVHAGHALSRESRSDDTSEPPTKWMSAARAARCVSSLNAPVNSDDGDVRMRVELLADEAALDPLDALEANRDVTRVRAVLATLPEREREVIEGRFYEESTLKEVGSGMVPARSRERVRQIERDTLHHMRGHLGNA